MAGFFGAHGCVARGAAEGLGLRLGHLDATRNQMNTVPKRNPRGALRLHGRSSCRALPSVHSWGAAPNHPPGPSGRYTAHREGGRVTQEPPAQGAHEAPRGHAPSSAAAAARAGAANGAEREGSGGEGGGTQGEAAVRGRGATAEVR
jgi:hypothetical protein